VAGFGRQAVEAWAGAENRIWLAATIGGLLESDIFSFLLLDYFSVLILKAARAEFDPRTNLWHYCLKMGRSGEPVSCFAFARSGTEDYFLKSIIDRSC